MHNVFYLPKHESQFRKLKFITSMGKQLKMEEESTIFFTVDIGPYICWLIKMKLIKMNFLSLGDI